MGYAMAIQMQYSRPLLSMVTYPQEWTEYYGQRNFLLCDPTVIWALSRTGAERWSDIQISDPFGVMDAAASHGLAYGAVVSCGALNAKTILGCGRDDREYTDDEMDEITRIAARIHDMTKNIPQLSNLQVEALRLFSQGYDYDEISGQLGISRTALKGRLAGARKRLEARSNVDAVRIAMERAILNANPYMGSLN